MHTKSKARGPGGLLKHLSRVDTNENVVVGASRFVSPDLPSAMLELAMLGATALGNKTIFHAIGSPDPGEMMSEKNWLRYWELFESEFKLEAASFIEVQHKKKNRNHRHRVYSLVNEAGTIIQTSHNYRRNELISRRAEFEFGHKMIPGRHQRWVARELQERFGLYLSLEAYEPPIAAFSEKENEQAKSKELNDTPDVFRRFIYDLFLEADRDWTNFAHLLDREGLAVARGDSVLMVVHAASNYQMPLARLLREQAKKQKNPIKIKSPDLEKVFGNAKTLGDVREFERRRQYTPAFLSLSSDHLIEDRSSGEPFRPVNQILSFDLNSTSKKSEDYDRSLAWTHELVPQPARTLFEGFTNVNDMPSSKGASLAALMNEVMTALRHREEERNDRLKKAKVKQNWQRYGQSAAQKIGHQVCTMVAANILAECRRQKLGLRLIILTITMLAQANALVPLALAAAAAALLRAGHLADKRQQFRADTDKVKAARAGFSFDRVNPRDRQNYGALANSALLQEGGMNANPALEALGPDKAARFITWWVHASDKQRGVVKKWMSMPAQKKDIKTNIFDGSAVIGRYDRITLDHPTPLKKPVSQETKTPIGAQNTKLDGKSPASPLHTPPKHKTLKKRGRRTARVRDGRGR